MVSSKSGIYISSSTLSSSSLARRFIVLSSIFPQSATLVSAKSVGDSHKSLVDASEHNFVSRTYVIDFNVVTHNYSKIVGKIFV